MLVVVAVGALLIAMNAIPAFPDKTKMHDTTQKQTRQEKEKTRALHFFIYVDLH